MKNLILFIAASWLIVTMTSFIARAFSQDSDVGEKKVDTSLILIKELNQLKKKNRTLDDSIARYKEKDSTIAEERKEITKGNKVIGDKLKVAVKKADENLKLISQQVHRPPAIFITIPKSREVVPFKRPNLQPLPDSLIQVDRSFWDKLFFRKKHRK